MFKRLHRFLRPAPGTERPTSLQVLMLLGAVALLTAFLSALTAGFLLPLLGAAQ
jgi:hypothetical protein